MANVDMSARNALLAKSAEERAHFGFGWNKESVVFERTERFCVSLIGQVDLFAPRCYSASHELATTFFPSARPAQTSERVSSSLQQRRA